LLLVEVRLTLMEQLSSSGARDKFVRRKITEDLEQGGLDIPRPAGDLTF
jgi:hypothetical protein